MQAWLLAQKRGVRYLAAQDVLFCIRHDEGKVRRLWSYLSWKDVRSKARDPPSAAGVGGSVGAGVGGVGGAAGGNATAEVVAAVADAEELLADAAGFDAMERHGKGRRKQMRLPWDVMSGFSDVLGVEDGEDTDSETPEVSEAYLATMQRLKAGLHLPSEVLSANGPISTQMSGQGQ